MKALNVKKVDHGKSWVHLSSFWALTYECTLVQWKLKLLNFFWPMTNITTLKDFNWSSLLSLIKLIKEVNRRSSQFHLSSHQVVIWLFYINSKAQQSLGVWNSNDLFTPSLYKFRIAFWMILYIFFLLI